MPELDQHASQSSDGNLITFDSSEADEMLNDLRALRAQIIDAWETRGAVLTRDEQKALRSEIQRTCSLLADLTSSD